jgi:DNA-binding response OmpR family regulator
MNSVEFEEIKIKLPELRTWLGEREIYPTLTELRLLMVLLSDPYYPFTSGELIRRLQLTGIASLSTTICHLRKRLFQKYVVTVHGCGYAFAAESHSQKGTTA